MSNSAAPGSTPIFVCLDRCRTYFLTLDAAVEHFTGSAVHADSAAKILTEEGNFGLRDWVTERTAHWIRMDVNYRQHLPIVAPPLEDPYLLVRRPGGSFRIRFSADTVREYAWVDMMSRGDLEVRFDHVDGRSGTCRLRNNESVRMLRKTSINTRRKEANNNT